MASPNGKRQACLLAMVASSLAIAYVVYCTEIVNFSQYVPQNTAKFTQAKENRSDFLRRQLKKKEQVKKHCRQYELDTLSLNKLPYKTLASIIVDDEHHVLYCQTPKVACTNWRRIFLILTGKLNTTNPLDIFSDDAHHKYKNKLRYLHQYSKEEIQHRMQYYLKFMITREPLERVVSAYRNKFCTEFNARFHKQFGRKIVKRYRPNASERSKVRGDDVTFPEFVSYLLDPKTVMENALNEHWIQQHKLCFPCTIDYDFIGQYEYLNSDADNILHYMNTKMNISFPSRSDTYSYSKTSDYVFSYFKQIPKDKLKDLYNMYYLDYAIFGYPSPQVFKKLKVDIDHT